MMGVEGSTASELVDQIFGLPRPEWMPSDVDFPEALREARLELGDDDTVLQNCCAKFADYVTSTLEAI